MSFSLDFAPLWTGANTMINGIGPAYLTIIGIVLGIAIVGVIAKAVNQFRP